MEESMKLRRLGSTALASAVLALSACSDHGTGQAAVSATRWQGPGFPGGGVAGLSQSIAAGVPALSCGDPTQFAFTKGPAPGARSRLLCFYDRETQPAAAVEWIVESTDEDDLVHVRLTLNPDFVDNTYGANSIGWPAKKGAGGMQPPKGMMMPMPMPMGPVNDKASHTFKDLVESDHAEFKLSDADGKLVLHFKVDYVSQLASASSGYTSLGVTGGEGRMLAGNANDIVAASTSLDRNLNACGLSKYTTDSPSTDASYSPSLGAEAWDFRVVYDIWVNAAAFGKSGFGKAVVDFVHASPSKADMPTSNVTEKPCPPTWRKYCNKPEGCSDRCGDSPDQFCGDAGVPPPPKQRCGEVPDQFCNDASVPPPPPKAGSEAPSDAPL
jgi:hypothetical protein